MKFELLGVEEDMLELRAKGGNYIKGEKGEV